MTAHYKKVAISGDYSQVYSDGGAIMKRAVLLLTGLCAAFGVSGILLFHSQAILDGTTPTNAVQKNEQTLSFPFFIHQTGLIAEQLVVYEGPFWEDGSGVDSVNTVALLIHNGNRQGIEHARVVLTTSAGQLVFEADMIPAGRSVLIPEKREAAYAHTLVLDYEGWVSVSQESWSWKDTLSIRQTGMGTVAITNETDRPLQDVKLYYKSFLSEPGFLIGGRSFVYVLPYIAQNQTIHICPKNYAKGYSEIVYIEWKNG